MNWKNSKRLVAIVAVVLGCTSCGNGAGTAERDEFLAGRQLVVDGKYKEATGPLEAFVTAHPNSKFCSRAGLFLGKAYLAQDDMPQAKKWFQWTVDNHPTTLEGHKCRYKLAMCAVLEEDYGEAGERFAALAEKPDGPLAAEATAWQRWLKKQAAAPPQADAGDE
ncbi:tetratricopeptide repeat protein [Aeoliella sp. ICT_H6.2]|uniref:Tetratricopeptide repeat protein n=1 Tax=Aeoliella straminimaris TaxID=2954799 RepID=A0A9X2F6G2_9BACT|nr:tetratricopeptide repeat protein [Aeoliella straminimaris]MCO6042639.1 tetratricopeptide repeat protein [Aeoliella straminimaris]